MENLQCDQKKDCTAPVTHISYKGYIYCTEHATWRGRRAATGDNARKMRQWEIELIKSGKPLPSYKPIRKPQAISN